jgi:hypothetical protein
MKAVCDEGKRFGGASEASFWITDEVVRERYVHEGANRSTSQGMKSTDVNSGVFLQQTCLLQSQMLEPWDLRI